MSLQNILLEIYATLKTKGMLNNAITQKLYTSSYFIYKRYYEDPFHIVMRRYPDLFKDGHILDIGAHIGYNSQIFAKALSPGFRVYAFEPDTENFIQLKKNCSHIPSIIPIRCAIGAKSGRVPLWRNEKHPGDHRIATEDFKKHVDNTGTKTIKVPITSIDDFVSKRKVTQVSFIKIDVQGYELSVCNGMGYTLQNNTHTAIAIEYSPVALSELGFNAKNLLSFWEKLGYRGYLMTLKGIRRENLASLHDIAIKKSYINILFLHNNNKILGNV